MIVRLAFAVAIHVDPEILLVDEALAVGDVYFRQRCMRKVHELRAKGITILFVSHSTGDIKALGDRALWLEHGRMMAIGETDLVVSKYLAAMAAKDSRLSLAGSSRSIRQHAYEAPAPEIVDSHSQHRSSLWGRARRGLGDRRIFPRRRALILASAILHHGRPNQRPRKSQSGPARSSDSCFAIIWGSISPAPIQPGKGYNLPPLLIGETCTVDFYLDLPALYASLFSFSPAVADGTLDQYSICDWIDNALVLPMERCRCTDLRPIPLSVPGAGKHQAWFRRNWLGSPGRVTEFTGERVIPGQVNDDLWAEHVARYAFAARFASGRRALDAGCGTGYGVDGWRARPHGLLAPTSRARRLTMPACMRPLPIALISKPRRRPCLSRQAPSISSPHLR